MIRLNIQFSSPTRRNEMGYLKDQLVDEIKSQGFSINTERAYTRAVGSLILFSKVSPHQLTINHVKKYKLHLIKELKRSPNTVNQYVAAIKFFFINVLKKNWNDSEIPAMKHSRKLPLILSQEEVLKILKAIKNYKHKVMLMGVYSCGLRIGELARLTSKDIDSQRMMIHIRESKNKKDRYVILSEIFLEHLRRYWKEDKASKNVYLFPGGNKDKPYNPSTINKILKKALRDSKITKKVSIHSLRHSYATHMLENGTSLRYIQILLGHSCISTTSIYTHLVDYRKSNIKTPLEFLNL
jgi:integrase/recombinase XerD